MAAVALDHLRGPATRTLHLPRGSLRPPIESWSQSDECCRVCGADKDYWRDDRPLYRVASPRAAGSRGPRGWIALCTEHGADPRIHAPVRTGRHLPATDRSVTLTYRLSRAEPCPVRKHIVAAYTNVSIFDTPAEADHRFARLLAQERADHRRKRAPHRHDRALRFDILVPEGTPTGYGSAAVRFAEDVADSFTHVAFRRSGSEWVVNHSTFTPEA
jgi:hypothetical protein